MNDLNKASVGHLSSQLWSKKYKISANVPRVSKMSNQKKPLVKLPFPMKQSNELDEEGVVHNDVRPKPKPYADKTWAPPRGTRRSFGKR